MYVYTTVTYDINGQRMFDNINKEIGNYLAQNKDLVSEVKRSKIRELYQILLFNVHNATQ